MYDKINQLWERYKEYKLYMIMGLVILALVFFILKPSNNDNEIIKDDLKTSTEHQTSDKTKVSDENKMSSNNSNLSNQNTTNKVKSIVVDVKGAVEHPDTYEMKDSQRIKDVLNKAKIKQNADLTSINLSEKLVDQKMIYVPEKGMAVSPSISTSNNSNTTGAILSKVNLNTAKETDLTTVNGLGPQKAKAILEYREKKGSFNNVEQLKEVKGIGEKSFEKLKDYFTV